jgi:ABC-type glycerol-3-phosphate transport system substrate-binding protein
MWRGRGLLLILLVGLLATVAQAQSTDQAPPPATATLSPVMAPSPDPIATDAPPISLQIWWVDTLAPIQGTSGELRESQLQAITEALPGVAVEVRLKPAEGAGGMLAALLAADAVAPAALPDLALVARRDLPYLIDAGLAQPVDNYISQAELDQLYPAAVALAELNGRLYGLPYALNLEHLAYAPPAAELNTFAGSFSAGRSLLLPLGAEQVSATVMAQYLSSGGLLTDGVLSELEEAPLRALLDYYAQATAAGVIDSRSTEYLDLGDTLPMLTSGEAKAGLVNTAGYETLRADQPAWLASTAPMNGETPVALVDGWLWVVLTAEARRQEAALAVVDGLLQAERLASYSNAVGALPATPAALALWSDADYATFAGELLAAAIPMPGETGDLAGVRLMSAVRQVVEGGSAEEAVAAALSDG